MQNNQSYVKTVKTVKTNKQAKPQTANDKQRGRQWARTDKRALKPI